MRKLLTFFQKYNSTNSIKTHEEEIRELTQTAADVEQWGFEFSQNFILDTKDYYIECIFYNFDSLFVTFENVFGDYIKTDKYRMGWGSRKFRSMQVSHLCIKPRRLDWYTGENLAEALADLLPFFERFERVITYGESMGGFGALAFADLVRAKYSISISPQSTLDRAKVPWDTRYPRGIKEDYSGRYGDAVGNYSNVDCAYILYDPHYEMDRRHASRLFSRNAKMIKLPFLGHGCSIDLIPMGATNYILNSVLDDSYNDTAFFKILRNRRERPRYYKFIREKVAKSHPSMLPTIEKFSSEFNKRSSTR